MRKYFVVFLIFLILPSYALAQGMFRITNEITVRGSVFTESELEKNSYRGEVKFSPRMEYYSGDLRLICSADIRGGYPDEMYEREFSAHRSNGKKPVGLLQECYVEYSPGKVMFRLGRFKPEEQIKFDFFRLSPFASLDSSEPFLSLDDDRLLGNWGGVLGYDFGLFSAEVIAFAHEDPIIATDPEDQWTRPLPFSYGEFKFEKKIDCGARLYGDHWELTFFNGSSQNANSIDADQARKEFDFIFPDQTSVQVAVQLPLGPFNLRAGGSQNWQEWYENTSAKSVGCISEAEFVSYISELEYIKENVFWEGDNLFLEVGYADVQDNGSPSELFIDNLGIDQIYRGGSILATIEYSPREDWVMKVRGIYNTEHESSYVCPEIRKMFFADFGEIDVYARGMIISGDSTDIISAYSENDNAEVGIKMFF